MTDITSHQHKMKRQKEFGTICASSAVGLLFVVFILSYFQERLRGLCKAKKHSKVKGLCTSTGAPTTDDVDADAETMQEKIRNSLVVKRYTILDDGGISATLGSSGGSMSGSTPSGVTSVPKDVETGNNDDNSEIESITEDSDSHEGTRNRNRRRPVVVETKPPKKLERMFSSLTGFTGISSSQNSLKNRTHEIVCQLCHKRFVNGDRVCESSSEICDHVFHYECIASWITLQNSCPCCSEPFVVVNMSEGPFS